MGGIHSFEEGLSRISVPTAAAVDSVELVKRGANKGEGGLQFFNRLHATVQDGLTAV